MHFIVPDACLLYLKMVVVSILTQSSLRTFLSMAKGEIGQVTVRKRDLSRYHPNLTTN